MLWSCCYEEGQARASASRRMGVFLDPVAIALVGQVEGISPRACSTGTKARHWSCVRSTPVEGGWQQACSSTTLFGRQGLQAFQHRVKAQPPVAPS